MILYQTADGQLWTEFALSKQTKKEVRQGWDEATQGTFTPASFNFSEWVIEAKLAGVIKEVQVNT